MDITPTLATGAQFVQSYGPSGFRIAGEVYIGPVIITPQKVFSWKMVDLANLMANDFLSLFDIHPKPEIVLLGCGKLGMLVPSKLRQELKAQGLSIDAMDTGAACRTYNVMLSEDRRVAAALMPA